MLLTTDTRRDPASELGDPDPARHELRLSAWYARPLDPGAAAALLATAHAQLHRPRATLRPAFPWLLWRLVARFWLGRCVEADRRNLPAAARDGRDRALADLVYGQLLMSRKLERAPRYLEAGFHALVPWLTAREYLQVLRRHERLGDLVLRPSPSPPRDLETLLIEAAVIRRLAGPAPRRRRYHGSHCDTAG